jgi:hypothetical protein
MVTEMPDFQFVPRMRAGILLGHINPRGYSAEERSCSEGYKTRLDGDKSGMLSVPKHDSALRGSRNSRKLHFDSSVCVPDQLRGDSTHDCRTRAEMIIELQMFIRGV